MKFAVLAAICAILCQSANAGDDEDMFRGCADAFKAMKMAMNGKDVWYISLYTEKTMHICQYFKILIRIDIFARTNEHNLFRVILQKFVV